MEIVEFIKNLDWANVIENFIAGALVVIIFSFIFPWWLKRSNILKHVLGLFAAIVGIAPQDTTKEEESGEE